jgi:Tol biopolymer transport system component
LSIPVTVTGLSGTDLDGAALWGLDWSVDGAALAVRAKPSGDSLSDIFVITLSATGSASAVDRLTNTSALEERHPRWSPDDAKIVISRSDSGDRDLVIVDVATGTTTALGLAGAEHPAWRR